MMPRCVAGVRFHFWSLKTLWQFYMTSQTRDYVLKSSGMQRMWLIHIYEENQRWQTRKERERIHEFVTESDSYVCQLLLQTCPFPPAFSSKTVRHTTPLPLVSSHHIYSFSLLWKLYLPSLISRWSASHLAATKNWLSVSRYVILM